MRYLIPIFLFAATSFGAIPDPVVTSTDSYNGYATVSGKLSTKPTHPVGISVLNGNTLSSTVTDASGRWSIVFRHRSVQFSVTSWDLSSPADRSAPVDGEISNEE